MRTLLFIASAAIYLHDGYRARIYMEIEILKRYFCIILLIPAVFGKKEDFGPDVDVRYFNQSNYNNRILKRIQSTHSLRKKVREIVAETGCIVYGEALWMSMALIFDIGREYKFVFDCHGTEPDEYYLYHHNFFGKVISLFLKMMETIVVGRSDATVTVTQTQFERWKVVKKHAVLPMLPGQHFLDKNNYRISRRKEMNIPGDSIVCVYAGSDAKWQMCTKTIKLFANLELTNPHLFLVIYTQKIDYFNKLIKKFKVKNALVKKVDYEDMPSYLDACDFGFCLRENSIINHVASPTKVMEYLSRNVKPILSEHVGDFSKIFGETGRAIVLNDGWDQISPRISFVKINGNEGREYIYKTRDKYIAGYLEMLSSLFKE